MNDDELVNHPDHFQDLKEREKQFLLQWISLTIKAAEKKIHGLSSYALKHRFERDGFYVTNGQFKGAMIAAGYAPVDAVINSSYCITPVVPYKRSSDADDMFKIPKEAAEEFAREMTAYKKTDEYRSG